MVFAPKLLEKSQELYQVPVEDTEDSLGKDTNKIRDLYIV